MGNWLWVIIGIMAAVIVALLIKIYLLLKSAREITAAIDEKLTTDTNTGIVISSRDRAMCHLADNINRQLRTLRDARHRFYQGDLELKNAVTNISHDLRTPLTAICGYLDLLEQEEQSETVERYLGIIRNRAELMIHLTEELFQYSMIVSSECVGQSEPVVLNDVLEESVAAFYTSLKQRGITPQICLPEQKVIRMLDRSALVRICSNLLQNVIKYSDGDLEITLTKRGELIFANTAKGLDEVQVGKLFDRFYTVESAHKSTGLGLSIARTLVEQMQGAITATYNDNRLSICILFPEEKKDSQSDDVSHSGF